MFASSRPDFDDETLKRRGEEAFSILVESVAQARGADPWSHADGPVDVAAAWALTQVAADLLPSGRLTFLGLTANEHADCVVTHFGRLNLAGPKSSTMSRAT